MRSAELFTAAYMYYVTLYGESGRQEVREEPRGPRLRFAPTLTPRISLPLWPQPKVDSASGILRLGGALCVDSKLLATCHAVASDASWPETHRSSPRALGTDE